ncbi:hypothetical protein C8J57DRAFT_1061779, partial [Mycena rebaudengoi]
ACVQLHHLLGSTLVQSSGTEFTGSIANTWNLLNAEIQPACIVFSRSSAHVQVAMKVIYETVSRYAVQAGSHSAIKGWNKCVSFP